MQFYNNERPNYEELKTVVPKWHNEIKELRGNLKFAGKLLDKMADDMEQLVKNQSIITADEKTISVWEDVLCLTENNQIKNLEERRSLVHAKIMLLDKLNKTSLKNAFTTTLGCDTEVFLNEVLNIILTKEKGEIGDLKNLVKILKEQLPAHIQCMISSRNNWWVLNGTVLLNGSRCLNATEIKEVL